MEILKYYQLKQELARNILHPLYFFYGQEDFLQEEATDAIIAKFCARPSSGFGVEKFGASELTVDKFSSAFQEMSFFEEKKVVVVSDVEKIKNTVGPEIALFLEEPRENTLLIFKSAEYKLPAKNILAGALKKLARCVIFYTLFPNALESWIKDYCRRCGFSLDGESAAQVAEVCDGNLRAIKTELDKIMLYASGKKTISSSDVKLMHGGQKASSVFDLGGFFYGRDLKRGLECIRELFRIRENETSILSYISKTIRRFAYAKLLAEQGAGREHIIEQLGIKYAFEKNMIDHLGKFSLNELAEMVSLVADAEYRLKTGGGTGKTVLSGLWLNLCKKKISRSCA